MSWPDGKSNYHEADLIGLNSWIKWYPYVLYKGLNWNFYEVLSLTNGIRAHGGVW